MRPRDILAANLKALMHARPDLGRFPAITAASEGKLVNGTLDRIRRAKVAITIDRLEDLADVFGLEPWQLLIEGLNPSALPRLADASMLSEILDAVERRQAATGRKGAPLSLAHRVEDQERPEEVVTPALEAGGLIEGKQQGGKRGPTGGVQKPGTRRRMQGAAAPRRKG